mgnify:CR=1 FL=1
MSEDKKSFGADRFEDLRAANAIERLNERSRGARVSLVVALVFGVIVLVLAISFIFNNVRGGGNNTPDIPTVNLR